MNAPSALTPILEQVPCDNCGHIESHFLFAGPDRLHGLPGNFSLVKCLHCGWIRQNPRPNSICLEKYYPKDYLPYANAIEDEKRFWNQLDRHYGVVKRCKSIERFVLRGRLLEVGCGTGIFLNEMHGRGWSVVGIEPNVYASDYVRNRFGLEVFTGTLEEFDLVPESFDVVCAWNVVEHLPTPAQDMRRMYKALKPGGLLVMSIPSLESLERRLFGEAWLGWDLPRHLYFFSGKELKAFMNRIGMQIVAVHCPAGSYHAFLLSVQLYLQDKFGRNVATKITNIARQLPARVIAFPAFWLLDAFKLSSLLTYFIRKT